MAETGSPEWHAERRKGIGASEIAAACGISKYMSRFRLWEIKTGRREPDQPNDAMRWGNRLEPHIIADWAEENVAEIIETQGRHIAATDPPIWATLDAIAELPSGERVIVEAKTTTSRNGELGDDGTDQAPMSWIAQVQIQMLACPLINEARIACLVDQREMREFRVAKDPALADKLVKAAFEFWRHVAGNIVPPAKWADIDERLTRQLYLPPQPEPLDWRESELSETWRYYEELGRNIREIEKDRELLKSEVIVAFGDNSRALLADGRELVIETVKRKGYTVAPSEYAQLKCRKVKQ